MLPYRHTFTDEDCTGKKAHVTDLIKQNINFPVFTFQREYFPLQPCFGLTINTAQGQTLQLVELDLRTPVYSNGMLWKSKMLLYQICDMCLFPVESSNIYAMQRTIKQHLPYDKSEAFQEQIMTLCLFGYCEINER